MWSATHTHILTAVQQSTHTHFSSKVIPGVGVNIQITLSELPPNWSSSRPGHYRSRVVFIPPHTRPPIWASARCGSTWVVWLPSFSCRRRYLADPSTDRHPNPVMGCFWIHTEPRAAPTPNSKINTEHLQVKQGKWNTFRFVHYREQFNLKYSTFLVV